MLLLVLLSGSATSQPDYSLPNLVLMAIYVGLTLVLAIVAIVAIIINTRQSRNALAASDRQSKDAIEAIHKQIDASERQAQEALYNQHKPIVRCHLDLCVKMERKQVCRERRHARSLQII